jgi:hypothetical protein
MLLLADQAGIEGEVPGSVEALPLGALQTGIGMLWRKVLGHRSFHVASLPDCGLPRDV